MDEEPIVERPNTPALQHPSTPSLALRLLALVGFRRAPMAPHLQAGKWGEKHAEKLLKKKGYKLLGRRVRIGNRDELDLVARDRQRNALVFIEVKTRASEDFGAPAESVDRDKERNLERAARAYIRRLRERPDYFRIDIVEVIGQPGRGAPEVRHLEDAVELRAPFDPHY
jgi:putative endonuclease